MNTVTLTREEYDELIDAKEMLQDVAAFDKAVTDELDSLPHIHMKRLIEGEAPLRVYRDWRQLTQQALCDASGVNRVQIANIESGQKSGSPETLKKLAEALGVYIDDLV